jgi:ribosome-associated toxin RatA of RatAB toxin-antitoxin module
MVRRLTRRQAAQIKAKERMTFEHSILIHAPAQELFALTQDYSRRLEWDCFLKAAYLLDGAQCAGIGVRANCIARNGLAMETEYISFNPPEVTAVKMTRGPWIIESFAGSWRFYEETQGRTRVYFKYSVRARPRWLAPLLSPVLAVVFARDTRKRLAALKSAVEDQGVLSSPIY